MGWVRISDDFYDHEKFAEAGPLGMALWTAGLAWCNRNLSDGRIPRSAALRLVDWETVADLMSAASSNGDSNGVTNGGSNAPRNSAVAEVVARKLVEVGLWTVTDAGFEVHDYLDYQRSAEQVKAEAQHNAARQKRFRETRKGQNRNAVTNGAVTGAPNPNPTQTPTESVDAADAASTSEPPTKKTRRGRRAPELPLPDDWEPLPRQHEKAKELGLDVEQQANRFRLHVKANDRRQRDWAATFDMWLEKAVDFGSGGASVTRIGQAVNPDGSINADAVLGKDTWQPESPPGHLEPGKPGYREWLREAWAAHHAERAEKAREVLARRSA